MSARRTTDSWRTTGTAPLTHAMRIPCPLSDLRTLCGRRLTACKGDCVASRPERVDCAALHRRDDVRPPHHRSPMTPGVP